MVRYLSDLMIQDVKDPYLSDFLNFLKTHNLTWDFFADCCRLVFVEEKEEASKDLDRFYSNGFGHDMYCTHTEVFPMEPGLDEAKGTENDDSASSSLLDPTMEELLESTTSPKESKYEEVELELDPNIGRLFLVQWDFENACNVLGKDSVVKSNSLDIASGVFKVNLSMRYTL
jgi:hypothetical protein